MKTRSQLNWSPNWSFYPVVQTVTAQGIAAAFETGRQTGRGENGAYRIAGKGVTKTGRGIPAGGTHPKKCGVAMRGRLCGLGVKVTNWSPNWSFYPVVQIVDMQGIAATVETGRQTGRGKNGVYRIAGKGIMKTGRENPAGGTHPKKGGHHDC